MTTFIIYLMVMGFSDTLQEAVKAFRWVALWRHISGQQEMSMIGHRDAFTNWRFTPLYKDPGLAGFLNGSHMCDFLYSTFSITTGSAGLAQTSGFLSIILCLYSISIMTL